MVRSLIGVLLGFFLSLLISTIGLALVWGGSAPSGSLSLSLVIAVLCVWFGGVVAGVIGEQRTLLHGSLVGLLIGGLVGLWPGSFPLKQLFFRVPIWRLAGVPITMFAGLLGGWLAGRLIAPGGLLVVNQSKKGNASEGHRPRYR